MRESFAELGIDGDELDTVVDAYREHYLKDGILDFAVYPGVVALLDALGAVSYTHLDVYKRQVSK